MKYKIEFSAESITDLTQKVNALLDDGWKPQGGVSTSGHVFSELDTTPTVICLQAMIKE